MEINLQALRIRAPAAAPLARYREAARVLTDNARAEAEDGVAFVRNLIQVLSIPPLSIYGVTREHVPELVEKAARSSSMKSNPITLSAEELTTILEKAL
jgi:alcohol dehydrogenase class IV